MATTRHQQEFCHPVDPYFNPYTNVPVTSDGAALEEAYFVIDETTGNSYMRGSSTLYGMEALWKWRSGHQKLTLQGEYLYLDQQGDITEIDTSGTAIQLESLKRHQDGAYLQAVYHRDRFGVGARYDRMEIFANTFERAGEEADSAYHKKFRANRARLIQTIYEIDPLTCPNCGGTMRVLVFIEEAAVIRKFLDHLGLWCFAGQTVLVADDDVR
jgi:hypothetical protein